MSTALEKHSFLRCAAASAHYLHAAHGAATASVTVYSESSKRTTRTVARTREPEWRQMFCWAGVSKADIAGAAALEVTVWNMQKNGQSEFLGEVRCERRSCCE